GLKEKYPLDEQLGQTILALLDQIHEEMYQKALQFRDENIRTANSYDEFKDILENKAGYIRMMWCGDENCESKIKEDTGATSRCIKEDEEAFGDVCPVCGKPAKKVVYFAKAY
ncbi:MAG: proline--tRNA ligase, partial [Faecalibacillus sp.]